ncbi:MAG: ATP-binding protein [Clostridia bacterium]|jgi:hypothetical protein|nr:ATP-binding protein [Clostridia bacterium]
MYLDDKRVRIICGHYGSGKTEFALNYVAALRKLTNKNVAISDMDIVNVYFRSREKKEELKKMGIKLIGSSINEYADVPAIPAEMRIPFIDKNYEYVIDLGGNDVGTVVLKKFVEYVNPEETDLFMVVNVFRPDTCDVPHIIEQKSSIEYTSGLKVTGFVNNTNLVRETKAETLLYGDKILREVSLKTNVPIKYTTYVEEVVEDMTPDIKKQLSGDVIPLKYYMRESWM